ncbi:Zinc ion binding protein [Phytophthora megakarya]|uniref:Zinc ion binding protein n=1 Tax=Phytophthora megakarya TaxID=4795 RepID=A0A225UL02_9STRA|nr:Zinc ion binding protein [Phytophthora megakarya]
MSSPTKGYVYGTRSTVAVRRLVDVSTKTCECPFMCQHGIPCCHFISVLTEIKQFHTVYDYVDDCYIVKTYVAMHDVENDQNIKLPTHHDPDTTVRERMRVVKIGRDQKKRIASGGEEPSSSTAKRRCCGNCGEFGHNVRTYRNDVVI